MEVIEVFYPNNGLGEDPVLHLEFKRFETLYVQLNHEHIRVA